MLGRSVIDVEFSFSGHMTPRKCLTAASDLFVNGAFRIRPLGSVPNYCFLARKAALALCLELAAETTLLGSMRVHFSQYTRGTAM